MRISDWSSDVCSSDLGAHGSNARIALADAPCGLDRHVARRRDRVVVPPARDPGRRSRLPPVQWRAGCDDRASAASVDLSPRALARRTHRRARRGRWPRSTLDGRGAAAMSADNPYDGQARIDIDGKIITVPMTRPENLNALSPSITRASWGIG